MGRELLTAYGLFLLEVVTALTVESGSPDALCPDLAQTREAVAARLGTLRVARPGWRARYTIGHSPDSTGGDFVRLEVFDPDGIARLQRDLPMTGRSCVDMAQALALVLDRYFRSLTAEPAAEGETSLPAPSPETTAAGATRPAQNTDIPTTAKPGVAPQPAAVAPRTPPPRPSTARWLLAGAGVAIASRPSSAGVSIAVATEPIARLELGFGAVALLAKEQQQVDGGVVSQQGFPLRAWATYAVIHGGLDLQLGPEVLGAVDVGQSVDGQHQSLRFLFGVGPRASVRSWPNPRFGFGVTGSVDFAATSGRFLVGTKEVLAPSPAQGLVALDITWLLIP
jgi:hypothetical protein